MPIPPTINAGADTLLSASANTQKRSDENSSYYQFLSTKQASDHRIEPNFECLNKVVQIVSKDLLQCRKACAELETIYIQTQGSSFTTQQNTLTRNGHVALIYVVASGDWKNADDNGSGFVLKRREQLHRGTQTSCGPGAFIACYPSELMTINAPESAEETYRVTIVYSVFIPEPMDESNDDNKVVTTSPPEYKLPWISQAQSNLSKLNPDTGEIIISFLGMREMVNLALSCKQFSGIAQVEEIMTKMVLECREELIIYHNTNGEESNYDLAIPLQWNYFTDSDRSNNRCEDYWLFGLDYVIFKVFKNVFPNWEFKCRKTILRCVNGPLEINDVQIIQAATGWELNYEDITEPIDLVFPPGKNMTLESWNAVLHISDYFQRSYDDDWDAFILWPFFCTRFIIGSEYFQGILNRLVPYSGFEVEDEDISSVYLYRSSCFMIRIDVTSLINMQDSGMESDKLWIPPVWIDD